MIYKSLDISKINKNFEQYSDKDWENLRNLAQEIDNENNTQYSNYCVELLDIKVLIQKIFGQYSKEFKYVNKLQVPRPQSEVRNYVEYQQQRIKEVKEKQRQIQLEKERKEARDKYTQECCEYLLNKGLKFGYGFDILNVIYIAEHTHFQELFEQYLMKLEPISFNGQNCDDCPGWIPGEHRCVCGNRRVELIQPDNFSIHTHYLIAEAY